MWRLMQQSQSKDDLCFASYLCRLFLGFLRNHFRRERLRGKAGNVRVKSSVIKADFIIVRNKTPLEVDSRLANKEKFIEQHARQYVLLLLQ